MSADYYESKDLLFKLRKIARYVEMYGVPRALVKVRARVHMKAAQGFDGTVWENSACRLPDDAERCIAVIGCGSFSYGVIGYYLAKSNSRFLRGAMDVSAARARSFTVRYGGAYASTDVNVLINDPAVRLIYIASNHASHAEYAIDAIRAGKHVHIEKPHVVSADQLDRLRGAMKEKPDVKVYLGFNRPRSKLFGRLMALLNAEDGPLMINWFVAGHKIEDDHWYFSPSEGGRILGNLCHWTDLTMEMVPPEDRWPIVIRTESPKSSKSDFVTTIVFGGGSVAAITFSAKGHTFDGVREVLNVHRGDLLAELRDFGTLRLAHGATRRSWKGRHRDHGHRANVLHSYERALSEAPQESVERQHVFASARLFLSVKEAHETGQAVTLWSEERAQGSA